jgi:hypothetical protein
VGAVTKVDEHDTVGTKKTADNLDVPNKPDVLSKPDVIINVDSLCPRKFRLECNRQHSTRPPDQSIPAKPVPAKPVPAKPVPAKTDDVREIYEYRDDYDDNDEAQVQVRETPHDPGGDGRPTKSSALDTLDGCEPVENDIGGGVQVPVTGEIHDGVADEAENIGGGAIKEILEKEKIPPDNENPPDVNPTVDTYSQVHIESAERFGADRRQQICLKSMMLPREECSSNFVKKLARKFADSPTTEICEHKPMMKYKLMDNLVGMAGTKASKEDTLSPRKTSLEGQGQPEQWPPPTGRRGRQAMTSPRQSPPIRLPPLARSIRAVNDERVHDRGAEVESADVEEGVVRVQDKGGEVETQVPKPEEIYEENDAEIVKRPDD